MHFAVLSLFGGIVGLLGGAIRLHVTAVVTHASVLVVGGGQKTVCLCQL